jgi:hypothetical protein
MRFFNLIFIFCAFSFLFTSCKEDEAEVKPLPSSIKEYVYFGSNSKWVFQNDSTLATDTLTVTSSSITRMCSYRDNDDYCWDDMKIEYFSSFSNSNFLDQTGYNSPGQIHRPTIRPGNPIFTTSSLTNQPTNYTYSSREYFSSVIMNGQTYTSVYKFHCDNKLVAGTTGYLAFDFYWARYVGNIKKVIYEDNNATSWTLIYKDVHK